MAESPETIEMARKIAQELKGKELTLGNLKRNLGEKSYNRVAWILNYATYRYPIYETEESPPRYGILD